MHISWIAFLIFIISRIVSRNKRKQEAERKAQQQQQSTATPTNTPLPSQPQSGSRAAMVEEQRRRAEAYRQQGQTMRVPTHSDDLAPWRRTVPSIPVEEAVPVPGPVIVPPVAPPVVTTAPNPRPVRRQQPVVQQPQAVARPQPVPARQTRAAGIAPAPEPQATTAPAFDLPAEGEDWRRALVLAEILSPPKAKRGPGMKGRAF